MSGRGLLLISIGVNLFLAVAVVRLGKVKFSAPPEKVSVVTRVVTNAAPVSTPEIQPAVTNVSLRAAFHWREIESDEYPVYIANLRKVNCPEKTIRSILIPDIEGLFEKRRTAMQTPATNFWMSGRARAAFNRERRQQSLALEAEESGLVKQLLGIDWFRSEQRRSFSRSFEEIILPYLLTATLSMEKTRDFSIMVSKYERMEREIREETGGVLLPEDEARLKELKTRMKSEVAQLLPPQEYEEFSLRSVAIQGFEVVEALKDSALVLSPDDLRKIMQLKLAGQDMMDEFKLFGSRGGVGVTPQRQKEIEQATKTLLGDARYTMFQEATDETFRSAKNFVETQHLPPQTSRAFFDIQKAAEDRAEEIRADQSLSPAERNQSLRQTRATIEAALAASIGVKLIEQYRENGGGWLDNISKKPK